MLFFYKKELETKEGEPKKFREDCFNVDEVLMGIQVEDNNFLVVMKDGHEESRYVSNPVISKEGKLIKDGIKQRMWVQSQIPLNNEDRDRFRKLYETDLSDYPEDMLIHRHD